MDRRFQLLWSAIIGALVLLFNPVQASADNDDFMTTVATDAGYFPLFESFNQRMVEVDGVYYLAYQQHDWSSGDDYAVGKVRIDKSTDKGRTWTSVYSGTNKTNQSPCLVTDGAGNLYVFYVVYSPGNNAYGTAHLMKYNIASATWVSDIALAEKTQVKWSFVYDAVHNSLFVSGRDDQLAQSKMFVREYSLSGVMLRETVLANGIGHFDNNDLFQDGHYSSLAVDNTGRLHLLYAPTQWPNNNIDEWYRTRIMYMYSDDRGVTWKRPNGVNSSGITVNLPFKANDYINGGLTVSTEPFQVLMSNYLVTDNDIHILYYRNGNSNIERYVRLDRATGAVEKRMDLVGQSGASSLIAGTSSSNLYLWGAYGDKPTLRVSYDSGDTWSVYSQIDYKANYPMFDMTAAKQSLTSDGYVIGAVDFLAGPGGYDGKLYTDVAFASFNVNKNNDYYRFEKNVAGTVPTDGQLLSLGGANQVKDSSGAQHGNATASDGVSYGSYQTAEGGAVAVPVAEIRGSAGNALFAKLDAGAGQGIDLGDLDLRSGLTLEGWFYPTSTGDYGTNTLITKSGGGLASGDYFLRINAGANKVNFGIKDSVGSFHEWYSSAGKLVWNQWNYIAVTWSKNTQDVRFHIKQPGGKLFSETQHIADAMGQFPNNGSHVKLGYNAGFGAAGFTGYADEVRISDYSRDEDELLTGDSSHYRLEQTASGATSVTNGSSLRLDGTFQIKDEALRFPGNPVSLNGTSWGSYRASDGAVTPVPFYKIKGANSNAFFGKLDSANQEAVSLGDLDVGTGLTLEGWIYPTGADADFGTSTFISKSDTFRPGAFWLRAHRTSGSLNFGVKDDAGTWHEWLGAAGKVKWNQWNYVAVTWTKNAAEVQFYVKQLDSPIFSERVQIGDTMGSFPNIDDSVRLGFNAGFNGHGFDGYFDEVRISNYKRLSQELLVLDDPYYRLEKSSTGNTPADNESLGKDGPAGIKDESGTLHGTPFSKDKLNFGTYQSSDGAVNPVPYTEIKGAASNGYFGKLGYANWESFDIGTYPVEDGLTIEGWFYPTGEKALWLNNFHIASKNYAYTARVTSQGEIIFGIYDRDIYRFWPVSAPNMVKWNEWNYIAITWRKDSKVVDFYTKQVGQTMVHSSSVNELITTGSYRDSASTVTIGGFKAAPWSFEGYFDEVRISDRKRGPNELLAVNNLSALPSGIHYYRMETTASDRVTIRDNDSLSLSGSGQVKDEYSTAHANPASSLDGTNVGQYQMLDNTTIAVPYSEIKGALYNKTYGKLSYANREAVNLGDLDAGTGLTLEGWLYPTGDASDFSASTFISKSDAFQAGSFWLRAHRATGSLNFGVKDNAGTWHEWSGSGNKVKWNQWNYVAVTWTKNSQDVQFYVKQIDKPVFSEAVHIGDTMGSFPNTGDSVRIGYNAGFGGHGLDGYFDEVRVSDFKRTADQLLYVDDRYYRFEQTASAATAVADNASLTLDGAIQIKDEFARLTGKPFSQNGVNFGTYQNLDNSVKPVPYTLIRGATGNQFFAKLDYGNREGIELGDADAGSGLTIEGWYYPTGDVNDALNSGRLLTKSTAAQAGNFYLTLTPTRGVSFVVQDPQGARTFNSSGDIVKWNQWNYIAVTWSKDSGFAKFYVKPLGEKMTVTNASNYGVAQGFPNTGDKVTIGYNVASGKGYTGYVDEVRISPYARARNNLTIAADRYYEGTLELSDDGYYRLEKTVSGATAVTDNASLSLDGTFQFKSESNAGHGNPISLSGTTFGTYQSADGSVTPVSPAEIKNAESNRYFGKLSAANDEGIDLGDLDVGRGLTLEGWFRPTGNPADALNNARLFTKRSGTFGAGNYWLYVNANGGLVFGIYDNSGTYHEWVSKNNMVTWNSWNYIAVTWRKGYADVEFFTKQPGNALVYDQITTSDTLGVFPNTDDKVTIGYNAGFDGGFDGYFDEIRITDRMLNLWELLVVE